MILNDLGIKNITHDNAKKTLRFAREDGHNPTSIIFNLDTLSYKCFSNNEKGNLYSLCMKRKELTFSQSLDFITDKAGLEKSQFQQDIKLPFGAFYKKLSKELIEPENSMNVYDEKILIPYLNKYNLLFFNDGINFQAQDEFKIGYDYETNRITIPEYSLDGKLIGIMGRLNEKNCPKEERYLPIIPCSRSLTLYGYSRNYSAIQEKDLCIIVESEKSILKLFIMGCNNAVATCGCHISDIQAKYLKALLVKRYIVCYDEGLNIDDIIEECKKLIVDNIIMKNQIGFVYDKDNKYLPKGSKLSPCDMPKDIFTSILKECVIWI
jgi:DNA primase